MERGSDARPHVVSYDPAPSYPVAGTEPVAGYGVLAAELAECRPCVVAVDGAAALPWERFATELGDALRAQGLSIRTLDIRRHFAPWHEIRRRTAAAELPGDPAFVRIFEGSLAELFAELPRVWTGHGVQVLVVFGPGRPRSRSARRGVQRRPATEHGGL